MEIKGNNCFKWVLCVSCCVFVITIIVALSGKYFRTHAATLAFYDLTRIRIWKSLQ